MPGGRSLCHAVILRSQSYDVACIRGGGKGLHNGHPVSLMFRETTFDRLRSFAVLLSAAVLCGLGACGGSDGDKSPQQPVTVQCGHPQGTKPQVQTGPFLYVTTRDAQGASVPGAIYGYQISTNGPIAIGSPTPTGVGPGAVAIDAGGQHVYTLNRGDGTISQYSVGVSGSLMPLSPATTAVGIPLDDTRSYLTVHPSGCFLYVASLTTAGSQSETMVAQFSITAAGTLQPLSPTILQAPVPLTGPLTIDAGGHAYFPGLVTGLDGVVSQFAVGMQGGLTPLSPATVNVSGLPLGVSLASKGAYVLSYCGPNCDGLIHQYPFGSDGALGTLLGSINLGSIIIPLALAFDAAGTHAYALTSNGIREGFLRPFVVDAAGGLSPATPASVPTAAGPVGPQGLALQGSDLFVLSAAAQASPQGEHLEGGHIEHFMTDSAGVVTPLETTTLTSGEPSAMTVLVYNPPAAAY